jgi:hypothetical protein
MPELIPALAVSAAQLHTFAANVNDSRVIDEIHELCIAHQVDARLVSGFVVEPNRNGKGAKIIFTLFTVDGDGEREQVYADGVPVDLDAEELRNVPIVTRTEQVSKPLKGELPTWLPQAARIVVPTREELSA